MIEKKYDDAYYDILSAAEEVYLKTLKHIETVVSKPTSEFNISFDQLMIMRTIDRGDVSTATDLAEFFAVTKGAIARQVKVLSAAKLIDIQSDNRDRRRALLSLTAEGRRVTIESRKKVEERFAQWLDVYPADKAWELIKLLQEFDEKIVRQALSE